MLGMTTIKILRARVAYLMHENTTLRRDNARLRQIIDISGVRLTEPQPRTPDYARVGRSGSIRSAASTLGAARTKHDHPSL